MATALSTGGPPALNQVMRKYGSPEFVIEESAVTGMVPDDWRRFTLAPSDCQRVVDALTTLAKGEDRRGTSLAILGLLPTDYSGRNLEFYKLDETIQLRSDYDTTQAGFGLWESELSHALLPLDSFLQVRKIISDWSRPTPERWEQKVFVQTEQGEEEVDPDEAVPRLIDPADEVSQVNIYIDHPLIIKYGSPYTDAKVWLEAESTRIILSESCCWSGDYRTDILNFISYRGLLKNLALPLRTHEVYFGHSRSLKPRALEDVEAMWDLFVNGLHEPLAGLKVPKWVRDEFDLCFAASL